MIRWRQLKSENLSEALRKRVWSVSMAFMHVAGWFQWFSKSAQPCMVCALIEWFRKCILQSECYTMHLRCTNGAMRSGKPKKCEFEKFLGNFPLTFKLAAFGFHLQSTFIFGFDLKTFSSHAQVLSSSPLNINEAIKSGQNKRRNHKARPTDNVKSLHKTREKTNYKKNWSG